MRTIRAAAVVAALSLTVVGTAAAAPAQYAPVPGQVVVDTCVEVTVVVDELRAELAALAVTDPARAAVQAELDAALALQLVLCADDPTATPTATPTVSPTATPTATGTPSPTATPRPTLTAVPVDPTDVPLPVDPGGSDVVDELPVGGVDTGDGSTTR